MGHIQGMTIQLAVRTTTGSDPFNRSVDEVQWEDVHNVLVSPAAAGDVEDAMTLYGKSASYTLCIPKGDEHIWEDTQVQFYGKKWRTIGYAKEYIEANLPRLPWNKQISVEAIEE